MNKRDWQADMALCEKATQEPWVSERAKLLPWSTVYPQDSFKFICDRVKHEDADFIAEARTALPYWLQQYAEATEERDELQSLAENFNADIRQLEQQVESLEREWRRTKYQLHESKDKEDKLKQAIETAINEKAVWGDPGNALDVVTRYLADTLASLYPKEATE